MFSVLIEITQFHNICFNKVCGSTGVTFFERPKFANKITAVLLRIWDYWILLLDFLENLNFNEYCGLSYFASSTQEQLIQSAITSTTHSFYITVCLQLNSNHIFLQIWHFLNFITSFQIRQTLNENYSKTFHCFLQSLHLPKHYYFELPIKILLIRNKNQKIRHPCGKPLLWYALMQKKNATCYYHNTLAHLAAGSRLLDYLLARINNNFAEWLIIEKSYICILIILLKLYHSAN